MVKHIFKKIVITDDVINILRDKNAKITDKLIVKGTSKELTKLSEGIYKLHKPKYEVVPQITYLGKVKGDTYTLKHKGALAALALC